MTKLYQVRDFQLEVVKTFESLDAAKAHADDLRTLLDVGFYVVELAVAYSSFPAHSRS